jgi:hypothetical protein
VVATPHPAGLDGLLTDVAAVPGSREAWAVGTENRNNLSLPFADRFLNGRWRVVPVPHSDASQRLFGVDAISAADAWAVGDDLSTNGPIAQHWDGSAWHLVPMPSHLGSLTAVEMLSGTDVWAVGEDFTTGGPLFEHWNGSAWSVFPVPNPFPAVEAPVVDVERVAGTGRLWAVGEGVAFQFAHGTWTFSQMPGFAAVDSLAIPAQRDVWAVGSSAGGGITEHFDGTRWTKFFTRGLYLVRCRFGFARRHLGDRHGCPVQRPVAARPSERGADGVGQGGPGPRGDRRRRRDRASARRNRLARGRQRRNPRRAAPARSALRPLTQASAARSRSRRRSARKAATARRR